MGRAFDTIFSEHRRSRLIVATFASNVDRVQQIITHAEKYGRKVVIDGRSMINVIGTAVELGYIQIPEDTLMEIDQIRNIPEEKTVIITTGSQGESMIRRGIQDLDSDSGTGGRSMNRPSALIPAWGFPTSPDHGSRRCGKRSSLRERKVERKGPSLRSREK